MRNSIQINRFKNGVDEQLRSLIFELNFEKMKDLPQKKAMMLTEIRQIAKSITNFSLAQLLQSYMEVLKEIEVVCEIEDKIVEKGIKFGKRLRDIFTGLVLIIEGKEIKKKRPSMTRSVSTYFNDLEKKQTPKVKREIRKKIMLCRVCEMFIPHDKLKTHSEKCRVTRNILLQLKTINEALEKTLVSISTRIRGSELGKIRRLQKKEKEIVQILAEIIEMGIHVHSKDTGEEELGKLLKQIQVLKKTAPTFGVVTSEGKVRDCRTLPTYFARCEPPMKKKRGLLKKAKKLVIGDLNLDKLQDISISDFKNLGLITKGAYGRVFLAKKKQTGDLFALKVMEKEELKRKNADVFKERDIMVKAQSSSLRSNPFCVKTYYTFKGKNFYFIVMEYCPGGDVFSLLRKEQFLEECQARDYAAELILALEFLEQNNIIHRDIKPDNVLIDRNGHLKLTDFGLSEFGFQLNQKTTISKKKSINFRDGIKINNNNNSPSSSSSSSSTASESSTSLTISSVFSHQLISKSSPKDITMLTPETPTNSNINRSRRLLLNNSSMTTNKKEVMLCEENNNPQLNQSYVMDFEDEIFSPFGNSNSNNNVQQSQTTPQSQQRQRKAIRGSPDYIAPELLQATTKRGFYKNRVTHGVDHFALGVLCFNMLFGFLPFNDTTVDRIFDNIRNGAINWPENIDAYMLSSDAIDFVKKLLEIDPKARLGGKGGCKEIKEHPWVKDIDWEKLREKTPWFVPELKDEEDMVHFIPREEYFNRGPSNNRNVNLRNNSKSLGFSFDDLLHSPKNTGSKKPHCSSTTNNDSLSQSKFIFDMMLSRDRKESFYFINFDELDKMNTLNEDEGNTPPGLANSKSVDDEDDVQFKMEDIVESGEEDKINNDLDTPSYFDESTLEF